MKPALLVIDFINDIVHENGKSNSCFNYVKEFEVIQKTNEAIKIARNHDIPIFFVKIGFSQQYNELPKTSPVFSGAQQKNAFKLGEWGTEFHETLDYHPSDIVIVKPRISPFYATALEAFLHAQQIDTLILSGVSTNNAIQSAARDGHDRDYQIIVLEDACGAKNKETHHNTLSLIKDFSSGIPVSMMIETVREKNK
jgi:ureidoacrylate peracid hydrolase